MDVSGSDVLCNHSDLENSRDADKRVGDSTKKKGKKGGRKQQRSEDEDREAKDSPMQTKCQCEASKKEMKSSARPAIPESSKSARVTTPHTKDVLSAKPLWATNTHTLFIRLLDFNPI